MVEDKILTRDGLTLHISSYIAGNAKTSKHVVIHHGFGEHSGRYNHVVDSFLEEKISVHTFDARGHGQSEGERGDAPGLMAFVHDLEDIIEYLMKKYSFRKPFLLGHSMGGLITAKFLTTHLNQWHLSGAGISGAGLKVHLNTVMQAKKVAAAVLAKITPTLSLEAGLELAALCTDPEVIRRYEQDPLVHGKASVRMALSLLSEGKPVIEAAERVRIPLWVGHGADDRITDPAGSIEFYERAGTAKKSLHIYPGLYHEIFNEKDQEAVKDIVRFVKNG